MLNLSGLKILLVGCDRQAIKSIVEVMPAYLASREGRSSVMGPALRTPCLW